MGKEYKKHKGEPKGRKYKCAWCSDFIYKEGKKLEIDEIIICTKCYEEPN